MEEGINAGVVCLNIMLKPEVKKYLDDFDHDGRIMSLHGEFNIAREIKSIFFMAGFLWPNSVQGVILISNLSDIS